MVNWPRADVLASCRQYAALLPVIDGIDPARLLAALAQGESFLGFNCGPRHEPKWDLGGKYAAEEEQAKNLAMYPYMAACSYGPWQIMFYNCPGYTPTDLNTNLSLASRATIGFLCRQIKRWNIKTVQGIGEMWNWGHPHRPGEADDPAGVELYCKDLAGNYIAAEDWLK